MRKISILQNIRRKFNSWNDWVTNIWAAIFPDNGSASTANNMTVSRYSGATADFTFPDTVNYDLAMALYYNTKAGYKLGAFFYHAIIALPLTFMGFPHFDIKEWEKQKNSDFWKKRFDYYNEKMIMIKKEIQKICHITGTIAVFPWFDSDSGFVRWNLIKSKYISDIYIDPAKQKLTGIVTTINYQFELNDIIYYFIEKKKYTESKIITTRTGRLPDNMRSSEIRRNPTGILPIIFTNDKEAGKFEGHSDFERILPIVKSYSEVNLSMHQQAANMKAKLVQQAEDYETWMENNGFTNRNDVNIENIDFIVNKSESEKTEFLVPQHVIDNCMIVLKNDYHSLVETSNIPEIWWGLKTEGNHASAMEQVSVGMAFVKEKQQQAHNPWYDVLDATMRLEGMAYNQNPPDNIIVTWDELNTLTEVERSQIFDNWCTGIQKLADVHGISLEGIHAMLLELTKGKITTKFEEFQKQIKEYGTIRAMLEQEYGGMRDGEDNQKDVIDEPGNGNGKGNKVFIGMEK